MHVKALIVFAGWIPGSCNAEPSSSSTTSGLGEVSHNPEKTLRDRLSGKWKSRKVTDSVKFSSSSREAEGAEIDNLDDDEEDPGFSVMENVGDLSFHDVMPYYDENIMRIRDPNYRFSPEARNSLGRLHTRKERRLDDHDASMDNRIRAAKSDFKSQSLKPVTSDGDRHSHDRIHSDDQSYNRHDTLGIKDNDRRKLMSDDDYEVIEFADGSSITRPVDAVEEKLQASTLVRNIWTAYKVRKLSGADHEKYMNETLSRHDWRSRPSDRRPAPNGRRVIDVENDFSVRHFDTSDPRYTRPENSFVSGHKRILQVPGGVQVDNSFVALPYRHPQQCERKQCLPPQSTNCREHLLGFYLKERGCANALDNGKQTCTACQYATSLDTPTVCQCEKVLFTRPSDYNQPCDSSRHCTVGECFRPCEFFLHVSTCPLGRCLWNTTSASCVLLPQAMMYSQWVVMVENVTAPVESARGKQITMMMPESQFPMTYDGLMRASKDYVIQGRPINDLANMVSLFQRLDKNYDGFITAEEFEELLTITLVELENEAHLQAQYALLPPSPNSAVSDKGLTEGMGTDLGASKSSSIIRSGGIFDTSKNQRLLEWNDDKNDFQNPILNSFDAAESPSRSDGSTRGYSYHEGGNEKSGTGIPLRVSLRRTNLPNDAGANERILQGGNVAAHQVQAITPDMCLKMKPPQFYCSISVTCIPSCSECGWKSVEATEFYICVAPSSSSCAQVNKYFCGTDEQCVTTCANCVGRRILDSSQKTCLAPWWYEQPSSDVSTWVCRHRRKVGRTCIHDQDCIYGMRKCSKAEGVTGVKQCLPLKPYEETHICSTHLDCPHINYYCPDDPTGNDIYWLKYCRRQLGEGRRCTSDVQCQVNMMCNTKEIPSPRCRKFFSLPLGHLTKDPLLCSTVWHNANFVCAYPAKSKNVGRPCTSYLQCQTTDSTGTFGECQCKAWWDKGNSKYCMPVPGDYDNHLEKLRDLVEFQTSKCGKFWTDDECKEEFGQQAINYFDQLLCEYNQLSKGPYLPNPSCNLGDGAGRYLDACAALKTPQKVSGKEGAEGLNHSERRSGALKFTIAILSLTMVIS